jgi:hypothetical protein
MSEKTSPFPPLPNPRPPPIDERPLLACCCPPVRGWRGLYVGLTRRVGNVPLVFCELLVLDCCPLEVVEALFVFVVLVDGDVVDDDVVDLLVDDDGVGDVVVVDDIVVPVFKGLLVLVHTPWALQLP